MPLEIAGTQQIIIESDLVVSSFVLHTTERPGGQIRSSLGNLIIILAGRQAQSGQFRTSNINTTHTPCALF